MAEDASSFWTDIQRYEDMLADDPLSYCFAPLSELYRRLGLVDDAISVAQKGCYTHPDYYGGFLALGAACYDKGLNDRARRALERALVLKQGNLRIQKLLGQIYVGEGEIALAKAMLGQVLRQNPDDLESEMLLRTLPATATMPEPEEELLEEAEELLEEAEVIEELTEILDEDFDQSDQSDQSEAAELAELVDEEFWELDLVEEPSAAPPALPPTAPLAALPAEPQRNPLATATMAELYASQGFIDKALSVYEQLLAADPANQPYRLRAIELLALEERQQAANGPTPAPASESWASSASAPANWSEPLATPPENRETSPATPAVSLESPAASPESLAASPVNSAAPPASPASSPQSPPPHEDLEAGLSSWLENIRRRRDGV